MVLYPAAGPVVTRRQDGGIYARFRTQSKPSFSSFLPQAPGDPFGYCVPTASYFKVHHLPQTSNQAALHGIHGVTTIILDKLVSEE